MAHSLKRKAESASTDGNISQKIKTSPSPTTTNNTATADDLVLESADFYIKDIDVKTYSGMKNLERTIQALSNRLRNEMTETQYYAFKSVPKKAALDRMNKDPTGVWRNTRITYFWDEEVMIVKLMSNTQHPILFSTLASPIICQVGGMGIEGHEFVNMGAATVHGQRISKEADAAFKPMWARPNSTDWPTLVIECGYAENRRQLRNDARLWISHSKSKVKIAVLILVDRRSKTLEIEKWYDLPGRPRRSPRFQTAGDSPRSSSTNVRVSHIPNTPVNQRGSWRVAGAPMILEFNQIFLRPAVWPETDISLTAADFQTLALLMWGQS